MDRDNIRDLPARHDHLTELSRIVESTIDSQLSLSKRLAKTENILRLTGIAFSVVGIALSVLILIQQYQITQL
tara:strand:- start:386 stop:604 length:219 start_codon:yes stop_codon:yes gene_type:complete